MDGRSRPQTEPAREERGCKPNRADTGGVFWSGLGGGWVDGEVEGEDRCCKPNQADIGGVLW